MRCPRCARTHPDSTLYCACGFAFAVREEDLDSWFNEVRSGLETAYLRARTPWEGSGKGGSYEEWARLRLPVAEAVTLSGSFLDIGCANGYLLQCLLEWTAHKGLAIKPYGLDLSWALVMLAQQRLPQHKGNFFTGNALTWEPPVRFDYVRTELVYVPVNFRRTFIRRLLDEFLTKSGKLLVAGYRSSADDLSVDHVDNHLREMGFKVSETTQGVDALGRERTRVAVLRPG